MTIINAYGDDKGNFSAVSGPGNFADGDMVRDEGRNILKKEKMIVS